MRYFLADVEVDDEPAHLSYQVVVAATTYPEARKLAREGALHRYSLDGGGWSLDPKATVQHITSMDEPTGPRVISVSEEKR